MNVFSGTSVSSDQAFDSFVLLLLLRNLITPLILGRLVPQQHLLLKTLTCGGQKSPSPFYNNEFFLALLKGMSYESSYGAKAGARP